MYTPENQYRCTIIRGKSQTDMEDLLPLYANIVDRLCPCKEDAFKDGARKMLAKALFSTSSYDSLSKANQKTVNNHLTEIAGALLGLYYPQTSDDGTLYIYKSESCKYLIENNDFPGFFKNLCLNFQFPNGAKKINYVLQDISKKINIKPFCYVVALLFHAQQQPERTILKKQEIGYYVLNNLDVLQGTVPVATVYNRIMEDRRNDVRRPRLRTQSEWQHINEQFNLLELANIVETNNSEIWLNRYEAASVGLFLKHLTSPMFDIYSYKLDTTAERARFYEDWKEYYGRFNTELLQHKTQFNTDIVIVSRDEMNSERGAVQSTVDLGDEGEALVFRLEQERVRKYKERLVNKVLLLGKTKGLGYDISSIEADENPEKPEFARYIEVKATKRVTEPRFDNNWNDSINLTAKEWIAAEQYGAYYNIYRVYFTKTKTIVVCINDPYKKFRDGEIEVYPTIYQMNFDSKVIERKYAD